MAPSIALKGSRRNHPIFIINFRLLTSALASALGEATASGADTRTRMRADNFGVRIRNGSFAKPLELLTMAQKRNTQSSPSESRLPSRRDLTQRPNSTERLKRMPDNGWRNFQRSRNPGKGRRTSKECIASLGKSLFLTYLLDGSCLWQRMNTACCLFKKVLLKLMDQKAKELFGVVTKSGRKLHLQRNPKSSSNSHLFDT